MHFSAASTVSNLESGSVSVKGGWKVNICAQNEAITALFLPNMTCKAPDTLDFAEGNGELEELVLGEVGRKAVDVDVGSLVRVVVSVVRRTRRQTTD